MNDKDFLERMKVVLDNEDITLDSKLSEIEEWDSLSIVGYYALADTAFNRKPDPARIKQCTSIRDLYAVLL